MADRRVSSSLTVMCCMLLRAGFFDNIRGRSTGLDKKLMERGVTDIFVCGIAFDFCAGSSACDAAELGFR